MNIMFFVIVIIYIIVLHRKERNIRSELYILIRKSI